jgi:hypothetical protein
LVLLAPISIGGGSETKLEALEGLIAVLQDNHQPLPEPQFITLAKVA